MKMWQEESSGDWSWTIPASIQTPIISDMQFSDKAIEVLGRFHFHQVKAEDQLHVFRGFPEDHKEVVPDLCWPLSACLPL